MSYVVRRLFGRLLAQKTLLSKINEMEAFLHLKNSIA
jgi:hypothetical protein